MLTRSASHIQRTTAETLTADEVLLACGTLSKRPDHFHADCRLVHDVESWLMWDELPRSMIVIGAGDTGLGHAILLGRLGVEVTVIDEQSSLRDLYRRLLVDSRIFDAQSLGIAFRLGDEVIGIDTRDNLQASVRLASGKTLVTEGVLVCVGRVGDTDRLGLEAAGVGLDERGRVWCDADGRTWASHIRAVGDVVGFASTNRGTESQRPDKFDRLPHIVGKRRDERLPFVRQRVGER